MGDRWDFVYNPITRLYEHKIRVCEFRYVSVKETLETLFEVPEFREVYFRHNQDHHCQEGIYEKFCCGSIYRTSEFYRRNPDALRIQLYYDDFTLSSSSKSQATLKMGALYFTLENIPTYLNSRLENIHLVAIFHAEDIRNFGESFNRVLSPFIQDIIDIHDNGIDIGEYFIFI